MITITLTAEDAALVSSILDDTIELNNSYIKSLDPTIEEDKDIKAVNARVEELIERLRISPHPKYNAFIARCENELGINENSIVRYYAGADLEGFRDASEDDRIDMFVAGIKPYREQLFEHFEAYTEEELEEQFFYISEAAPVLRSWQEKTNENR
jgi:hypothetical protein